MPAVSVSTDSSFRIVSDDPDVQTLQSFVFGLHHFDTRQLSMRHFKIIIAVALCKKVFKVDGTKPQIAALARLKMDEMEPEFGELMDKKYIHEAVPIYGSDPFTYRLGSMGGTLVRHLLKDQAHEFEPPQAPKRLRTRRTQRAKANA